MRNAKLTTALFTAALATSSVALADKPMGKVGHIDGDLGGHHFRVKGSFDHADSNNDGRISRDEWFRESEHVFQQLDENGDRTLTTKEFSALPMVRELP